MNTSEFQRNLPDYADGELDPELRAEVEARLEDDPQGRAEVERWRALRRCAGRALNSEPVPAGLQERVQTALRRRPARHPRVYRLGLPGLAVAAAITLAFFLWPQGVAATSVKACDFASIHRKCALEHRHDSFNVRGGVFPQVLDKLTEGAGFACCVPNVTACGGYRLDGACRCSPCKDVRVVHVYFRSDDPSQQVVSAFAIDCRVNLCSANGSACPGCEHGQRHYHGGLDGDIAIVCWDEGNQSCVLAAGGMEPQKLVQFAQGVPVAQLPQIDRVPGCCLADAKCP